VDKRALYKQKYQAQIHEWKAKLDVMKAQGEKLSAQAMLDAKPRLDQVHAKLEAAKGALQGFAGVAEDKWDVTVKDAERIWLDFKSAAQGAHDAVNRPEKS
jgi:hypothetical protein